ncbi:MAG: PqqD family peptide modification chaperone [Myxococcales bacterium]
MANEERYVLVEVPPGGLLLDRESGLTLELNAAAALAWRLRLAGETFDGIVTRFAAHFRVSLETAGADVSRSLRDLPLPERGPPSSEFRYQRSNQGYVFSRNGEPVFVVDERGERISSPIAARAGAEHVGMLLYGLCPKLLSLRGHTVLHASAVAIDGRAIAFSGHSGAGKTTTAHALVQAGATLVCEDKLVLHRNADELQVSAVAEEALRRWVRMAAVQLMSGSSVSCTPLDQPLPGPTARLREIGFLSAERRGTSREISAVPLSALQAAGTIFNNSFYGSDAPADWARQLQASARIASEIAGYEVIMPDGLDFLAGTVRAVVAARSLRSK